MSSYVGDSCPIDDIQEELEHSFHDSDPSELNLSPNDFVSMGKTELMVPPFYGMPHWGMYSAAGMIQGQTQHPNAPPPPHVQQQIMAQQRNGQRPMTPQRPNDDSNQPSDAGISIPPQGQYKMIDVVDFNNVDPHHYYDQNGPLIMRNAAAAAAVARNINSMRLMPQMLINPAHNQGPNNNLRLISGQGQAAMANHTGPATLFSSSTSNVDSNSLYTSENNSALGYPNSAVTSSNIANASHSLGYNLAHNIGQGGYGNNGLGSLGSSLASIINDLSLGNSSPRRDSYDAQRAPDNAVRGGMFSSFDGNQVS